MRPYPAYKDSGVEWLGEVPEGWEVLRLGTLFTEINEAGSDDLPILSVSIHSGVSDDELNPDELERKVSRSEDRSKYKAVQKGDLVYNMMRAWQGGFGSVAVNGQVSPAYVVARPKAGIDFITAFIESLLRTPYAVEEMRGLSRGVTDFRLRLYWDEFKTIRVALPPLPEQQAIARFLDKEVAKIDALVAEQRRLIALLAEKRQAVISHAVTKGLNPATPLKPSGIDWLGDIPEGWEVVAIKRIVSMRSGDAITAEDIEPEGEFPVFGGNGLRGYTDAFTHAGSYILIGRQGALCGNINHAEGRFWASEHAVVVTPIVSLDLRWLGATLETMNLNQYSTSAAQPGLSVEVIAKLRLAVPPLDEQGAIAAHILEKTAQFDALTDAATSAISLLQERRAALISAAVTGKIDLRPHFAQTLSEPESA